MAYCGPKGIPHSHYLGGPNEWRQDDRDKVMAWLEMEAQTCTGCGTRPEEWSPDKGGDRRAYVAEVRVCHGCEVRERGETEMNDPTRRMQRGLKLVMRRRSPSS